MDPATMKLAAARGETAGGSDEADEASSPAGGSKTAKGTKVNPTGVAGILTIPARSR
jgi:hypothetical protein